RIEFLRVFGNVLELADQCVGILVHLDIAFDRPFGLLFEIAGAAIPELQVIVSRIPEGRRAAPDLRAARAFGANASATFAHRQAAPIAEAEIGMMAGGAGDRVVA